MEFYLGKLILSLNLPDYLTFVILYFAEFSIILVLMVITAFITEFTERKIIGSLKNRYSGLTVKVSDSLKIFANAVKLFFKENIVPDKAEIPAFILAPIIIFIPVLFTYSLIPFNTDFCVNKSESGLLLFAAMLIISPLGMLIGGLSSKNKFSVLGAMRNCIRIISIVIPFMLTIMSIVILSESLSLQQIVISQAKHDIFSWYIFPEFLGFILFFIILSALTKKGPLSFSTSGSELSEGCKTEYSAINCALINLSEFALLFIIAILTVTLFFGGFLSPFGTYIADWFEAGSFYYILLTVEQLFWLFAKTIGLILLVFIIQTFLPEFKPSDSSAFCWKYLIPLSIINILVVSLIKLAFGGFYVS